MTLRETVFYTRMMIRTMYNVHAKDVEELKAKIQREADRSTDWVSDNRSSENPC